MERELSSQEVIVGIVWIIMGLGFGIERLVFALGSLKSGKTRRKRPLANQYNPDPDVRGVDVCRDSQPVQFYSLVSVWFVVSAICFVSAAVALGFLLFPEIFPADFLKS